MFGFKSKQQRMLELLRNVAIADQQRERLVRFSETIVAQGHKAPCGERADIKLCGATAGLFARQVNANRAVSASASLSDRDFAVVWVALTSVDMACQLTGTDMELAMLVMPVWLCAPHVFQTSDEIERLLVGVINAHNRMMGAPEANRLGEDVAGRFSDWALKGYKEPIDVVRGRLDGYADLLHVFRR
ncbi:hypothetical protein [Rhodoplanes sp. SY1]|uniref:hypothetical protein n=1 Tax=Rhodoplanes sp. SY1 TaxID=3166646 RepID=UPI0038B4B6EB